MSYVLAIKYSVITLVFIPLFVAIVIRMKQISSPEIFSQIRCKTITLFSIYTLILLFRLFTYYDLIVAYNVLPQMEIDNELPLYITEILMTLMIIYMLISNSVSSSGDSN